MLVGSVALFVALGFPQLAVAEDNESEPEETSHSTPEPTRTPKPSPSPSKSWTPKPKPLPSESPSELPGSTDHDSDDHDEANGHDDSHDISTPPLLIRPNLPPSNPSSHLGTSGGAHSGTSSNNFYSAPLGKYLDREFLETDMDSDASGVTSFDANQNPPVIQNIVATSYATPADEFMAKSYIGLGVLGIAAGVMTVVVLKRGRGKSSYFEP